MYMLFIMSFRKSSFTLFHSFVTMGGLLSVFLFGCSADADHLTEAIPAEITVSTGFGSVSAVETRSGGSITESEIQKGKPLPLSIIRTDQKSESDALYLPYSKVAPLPGRMESSGSDVVVKFDTSEYYLARDNNDYTKLIAWYPSVHSGESEWEVDESSAEATVHFTVDGETDILVSNLLEGNEKVAPFDQATDKLKFQHLLTRIRVRVYTTDAAVEDMWGGVKTISIADKAQSCMVQLPDVNSPSNTFPTGITFGEEKAALSIIPKDPSDNSDIADYDDGVLPIPVVAKYTAKDPVGLAGYAMVAPEKGALYLTIVTEKMTTAPPLEVNAPNDGAFEAGHSYTIALGFTTTHGIRVNATVQDWEDAGGEDVDQFE